MVQIGNQLFDGAERSFDTCGKKHHDVGRNAELTVGKQFHQQRDQRSVRFADGDRGLQTTVTEDLANRRSRMLAGFWRSAAAAGPVLWSGCKGEKGPSGRNRRQLPRSQCLWMSGRGASRDKSGSPAIMLRRCLPRCGQGVSSRCGRVRAAPVCACHADGVVTHRCASRLQSAVRKWSAAYWTVCGKVKMNCSMSFRIFWIKEPAG